MEMELTYYWLKLRSFWSRNWVIRRNKGDTAGKMMMVDMKEVERFYLEASNHTYAADAPKITIEALPKSKVLRYERDDFLYTDLYFSSGKKSGGQTTIWYKGNPVWSMQYQGWWEHNDKRVIPFLKRALLVAYQKGEFVGGRGPELYEERSLRYVNRTWRKKFEDFNGDDEIWEERKLLYHHHYEGLALP